MKILPLTLVLLAAAATYAVSDPTPAAPPKPADAAHDLACSQLKALNDKEKVDVQALDGQIKALRDGQLKPLEDQRKALTEQSRSQKEALMDQIVPGTGATRQSYDAQIQTLNDQEQAEVKAVHEKYAASRHALTPPKAALHCR